MIPYDTAKQVLAAYPEPPEDTPLARLAHAIGVLDLTGPRPDSDVLLDTTPGLYGPDAAPTAFTYGDLVQVLMLAQRRNRQALTAGQALVSLEGALHTIVQNLEDSEKDAQHVASARAAACPAGQSCYRLDEIEGF